MTQTCQSNGNNSDPERFVSILPVANTSVDAEKLHNDGSNGVRNLQQAYTKLDDHQDQINEAPDISEYATQSKTQVPILSSTHSDNQSNFHSNETLSQYLESQGQDNEILSYGDHNSVENLSAQVKRDSTLVSVEQRSKLRHSGINDVNKEKNPVAVSESDSDDEIDGGPNPLPATDNTNDCAKSTMLMASRNIGVYHVTKNIYVHIFQYFCSYGISTICKIGNCDLFSMFPNSYDCMSVGQSFKNKNPMYRLCL